MSDILEFGFESNKEVKLGYTTKVLGNMIANDNNDLKETLENRRALSQHLDLHLDHFIFGKQTHSNNLTYVSRKDAPKGTIHFEEGYDNVDGLYTDASNVLLGFFFADCMPVYFIAKQYVGILHAGMPGCLNDFPIVALQQFMDETNVKPKDIYIHIGPRGSVDAMKSESISKYVNNNSFDYDIIISEIIKKLCIPIDNIKVENIFTDKSANLYSFANGDVYKRACGYIIKGM